MGGTGLSQFKSWNSYTKFAHRIQRRSRYVRSSEDEEFLREVVRTAKIRERVVRAGYSLWRAQLGHGWRPFQSDSEYVGDIPCAYPPERMKPIPGRATEGRANPKGIPVLYMSNRRDTAMSEVRPWIGSLVSCARFETTKDLTLVDLSVHHAASFVFYFEEPKPATRARTVWTQIDQAFAKPVTSADQTADYVPTQIISELFKHEGYDGLAYKSAFGESGYNIALFDLESARLTTCTLYQVDSAFFSFKEADNPYWVDKEETVNTIAVDVVGPAEDPPD